MYKIISFLFLLSFISILIAGPVYCYADEDEDLYKAKENICTLIEAGKFAEAKLATDKITIEFPGLAKLPEMLYWIAGRYQVFDRFEDAKQIQEQIISDYPSSPWAGKAKMGSAMTEAISLVVSGKFAEAKAVTAQMASDFSGSPDLAEMLFWIAERYQRIDRFDESKQIYQRIIDDFPAASFAQKAKFAISRAQVESLIVSQKYDDANAALDKFIADYSKSPDLPGALFWITERYERLAQLDYAKQNYQRIIDQFPNNPWAKRAKLGIARAEVIALVEAGDFSKADASLNKMTADFMSHSDLPWSLYLVAQRYKSKSKQENAIRLYQQIVQNYPDNIYAGKAQAALSGQSSEKSVSPITVIRDVNDESKAVVLYRIARGYEDSNNISLAKQTYEQITKDYPTTIKGSNSVLDIRRLEILEKLNAGDTTQASALIDKFIADFKGRNDIYTSAYKLGKVSYNNYSLLEKSGKGDSAEGRNYLIITTKMLDIVISEIPYSDDLSYTLYIDGYCHYQLGECKKSADIFQKLVDDFPNYEGAWNALYMAAESYQGLKRTGMMSAAEADSQTLAAYTRLLKTYPNCPAAIVAQQWVDKQKSN